MSTTATITRKVESNTEDRVSRADFKGYQLTFTEKRQLGQLISVNIHGIKTTEPGINESVSLYYSPQASGFPSISFTPVTSVDAELANAIGIELEAIKVDESEV